MKKLFKFTLLIMIVILLVSCKGGGGNDDGGGDANDPSSVIFSTTVEASIVRSDDAAFDTRAVSDRIYELTGKFATVISDTNSPVEHEIVFGDTSRSISSIAKEKLGKAILDKEREAEDNGVISANLDGFAVYSDGKSVAVVWSDPIIAEYAVARFQRTPRWTGTWA